MPDTALEFDGFPGAGIGLLRNPRLGKDQTHARADPLHRKELARYEHVLSPLLDQPAFADHALNIFTTPGPLPDWLIDLED